ncbi:archaemetzincin-2 isoform x2 [Stylonychia lemnae]|uniref:Archaemetzincin-2 isoform x2 n=1 Tax=Stylonychia lemnae TaxID=5949 RepID=A0A078B475_STYLE|nr:archaemetzincin-2 isoform x2 [Stylonychia lemnae]|eukprot:CDW89051.1 archaemetzincin-2 isoform x2 [Stylonychia lemnae]
MALKNVDDYWLPINSPGPSDWLANEHESGQTCKIKTLPSVDINTIENIETRKFPGDQYAPDTPGLLQYNASQIISWLAKIYKPKNPKAICIIAITTQDIYPDEKFSFLFGLANITTQVGVFSFLRYDPLFNGDILNQGDDGSNLMLHRACKVMTHEIGHMFGIKHCIYHECCMNGINHIQECQNKPLYYCAICLRKLQHAIGFDVLERYQSLTQI